MSLQIRFYIYPYIYSIQCIEQKKNFYLDMVCFGYVYERLKQQLLLALRFAIIGV